MNVNLFKIIDARDNFRHNSHSIFLAFSLTVIVRSTSIYHQGLRFFLIADEREDVSALHITHGAVDGRVHGEATLRVLVIVRLTLCPADRQSRDLNT